MKIQFSLGGDAAVHVAFDMNSKEFMAMKKAFMWCDFSKMTEAERKAAEQITRTLSKITIPE